MEEITVEKSANQLWRESKTSLSFSDWIQREKDKGNFLLNKKVQDTLADWRTDLGIGVSNTNSPSNHNDNSTFVGLDKRVIYVSLLIVALGIGYKIYQKNK